MAQRIIRDHEASGCERSDFPILCQSCVGDNPYLRMVQPLLSSMHPSNTVFDIFMLLVLVSVWLLNHLFEGPLTLTQSLSR